MPQRPIKEEKNTELSFLQKMLIKDGREITPELLENFKPTKKITRKVDNADDLRKADTNSLEDGEIVDGMEEE